ncbi:MAG: hypothetical protein ACYC3G_01925 [Minisyncoccota bacterium]
MKNIFEKVNGWINNKIEKIESRYYFEEVFRELEPLTFSLVEKLKENIDKNEYDMLIGDDASGRIPTLVLRGIINERKRRSHPELRSSESGIKTRFVAGGQIDNSKELDTAIQKLRSEAKKKVLVVTEFISSGKSINRFSEALQRYNIAFDIAAFISEPESLKIPDDSKFFYGDKFQDLEVNPLSFYDVPEISGVQKGSEKDFGPRSYTTSFIKDSVSDRSIINKDGLKDAQEKINIARKDVDLLVNKTLEKVWGDKNN